MGAPYPTGACFARSSAMISRCAKHSNPRNIEAAFRPIAYLLVTLCLLATTSAVGQTIRRPYLFEVRKGENVSWLFGSNHEGIDISEVNAHLEAPIRNSDTVFMEMFFSSRSQRAPERAALWKTDPAEAVLTSPDIDLLKGELLPEETRQYLIEKLGMPPKLGNVLRTSSCRAFDAYIGENIPRLDEQVETVVRKMNKRMVALDNPHLRALAREANEKARPHLKESNRADCNLMGIIEYHEQDKDYRAQLDEKYRQGQYKWGEVYSSPGLIIRNNAWMRALIPELNHGRKIVIVGVAHLFGQSGLIRQLQAAGFTVERVSSGP